MHVSLISYTYFFHTEQTPHITDKNQGSWLTTVLVAQVLSPHTNCKKINLAY